ncbi:MAG: PAS domain-containing sensor histidine kinase [Actinomycetota bacterium]
MDAETLSVAAEALGASALAQLPAVVWAIDREMRFTASTGRALTALGLNAGEAVGRTLPEFFGTEDPDFPAIAAHARALAGESTSYEQNWLGRRFETRVEPRYDETGAIVGALGVSLDVTDRMWEPGTLFETEAKYRGLIETLPAVTYVDPLDEWSDSLYVSPQIEDLLGVSAEEWLTDPNTWRRHVHPDDLERAWNTYVAARDAEAPYEQEYRMLHEDGRVVWVNERGVVLRDAEGHPWVAQGVFLDITERKRAEEEVQRAWERERETSEHLRSLDELKSLLLHAVSHDLRGPITAILGSALVLEDGDRGLDEDKRADLVHGIAASARKLNRLVTDLLDLDRLERGIVEPDRRPTDVGALVRRVVAERGLEDTVEISTSSGEADVDPVQVERIIENLVVNARKHTPSGTPIRVEVVRDVDGVELDVTDGGQGVPAEIREVIFEPFRQGKGGPGLGIGLSLVARFAALHGGRAWVEDAEGGGARFRVTLPRAGVADI